MIKKLAPLFLALVAAACGGDTTLSIADLDTSCKVDKDCVTVDIGDACACLCGSASINAADLPKYTLELQQKQDSCGSIKECDCIPTESECDAGKCALVR